MLQEDNNTDNKAIEEKALNYFKSFIEDSKVISQFIDDNDKEPCWDGHLYIYSEGKRDKEHLQGRVPVQIKGTEVDEFIIKKWKFKLEKDDLKAYLNEPTFFIVCQIKKDSKERMLFYKELLPDCVKRLLRDMGKNATRLTKFLPLSNDLGEFEDQLKVFMGNSKKMISFANSKPLSLADAIGKGINEFSFVAPHRFPNQMKALKYLSTHDTYLFAKYSKEFDVDIPISDGPSRFSFKRNDGGDVKVGEKVFFKGFRSEIINGRIIVNVSDVMTMNLPMDDVDIVEPIVKVTTKSKYLKESINEAEFILALNDVGVLTLGNVNLRMAVNERDSVEKMRMELEGWKMLDNVLDKLHVTKPFDLSGITQEQIHQINLLIETIGEGKTVRLPGQQSSLVLMEISNLKLLLWCEVLENGECRIGDYFDGTVEMGCRLNDNEIINVSLFSYLQVENYWGKIDNIDYNSLVKSAQQAANKNEACYEMSNYDVLAMISAADAIESTDSTRNKRLLDEAMKLNEWLMKNDPINGRLQVHLINKYQIKKRQGVLSSADKKEIDSILINKNSETQLKIAAHLLLDQHKEAEKLVSMLPKAEKMQLTKFPIWKFYQV